MKIEAANLVLYNEDWDNLELDLSPAQLEVVLKILNIKFNNDGTYNCRPDEYVKKIVLPEIEKIR